MDAFLPLLLFAPFFLTLLVFSLRRQGCPDCGALMSSFKLTRRQWIEGGYLCRNCGCECTLAGRKVPAGSPVRRVSVAEVAGLSAALALAGVLLYAGFTLTGRAAATATVPPPIIAPPLQVAPEPPIPNP
jgi:hypothetical protein